MPDVESLLGVIRELHEGIRDAVVAACESQSAEQLSAVESDEGSDTIYAIDRISEEFLVRHLEKAARDTPLVLIAEGLPGEKLVLPRSSNESDALWRIIVDPIDGTRGLMYQKRSAWVLTGVAPNRPGAALKDIELAMQTEIPVLKQHLCDCVWAVRGKGAKAERRNRLTGERLPLHLAPSGARTIEHGFAMISRFFPGARDVLAAIDEEVVLGAVGSLPEGKAICFEDQYASTGGQLYELMSGRDRFNADLRPLMQGELERRGLPRGVCCHPYDICTHLIASELGVILTDPAGGPLDAPLDVQTPVAWVGYANEWICGQVEPAFQAALRKRGLID